MTDEPDPPRKFYKLASAKFERVNEARPEATEGPAFLPEGTAAPPPLPEQPNDVHRVLLENRAVDQAAGLFDVAPLPPRKSRRKRDYWILMITGNTFFGASLAYWGIHSIPGVFGLSGMVLFSTTVTWIMWMLLDNY